MSESVQATGTDAAECKLCAVQKGYWKDDYIPFFVKSKKRTMPLINRGYYARVQGLDTLIKTFITSNSKSKQCPSSISCQIVSLGAGRDTTYFRLRSLFSNCHYIEVDLPQVVGQKIQSICTRNELRDRLEMKSEWKKQIKDDFSGLSTGKYSLFTCDIGNIEKLKRTLTEYGFQTR